MRDLVEIKEQAKVWTCADGTRIVGKVFAPLGAQAAQSPPVILCHGGGQTRRAWAKTAKALARLGICAAIFDTRGHGQSDRAPLGGYDEPHLVQDLEAIAADLGGGPVLLIGASVGGIAAICAVGSGRVAAAGLCLVDIAPRTEHQGYARIRAFMLSGLAGFASLDEAGAAVVAYRDAPSRADNTGLAKALVLGEDGRYRWHWDPAFLDARHADIGTREERLSALAQQIDCPLRLIRGGSSDVVSKEGAAAFLALCPHAEYVDIQDAGHMISGDHNDAFGQAIEDFVLRVTQGQGQPRQISPLHV